MGRQIISAHAHAERVTRSLTMLYESKPSSRLMYSYLFIILYYIIFMPAVFFSKSQEWCHALCWLCIAFSRNCVGSCAKMTFTGVAVAEFILTSRSTTFHFQNLHDFYASGEGRGSCLIVNDFRPVISSTATWTGIDCFSMNIISCSYCLLLISDRYHCHHYHITYIINN